MGTSSGNRDLHIDQVLSTVAIGYAMNNGIAGQIAPVIPVQKQSDLYLVYSRADALRIENTTRAPDTEARKITRSVSSDTFYAENYALKYPVTLEDKTNMDPAYTQHLYNGRVEYTTDKLLLDWENRVVDLVTNTSNVGSSAGVSSAWTAGTDADVIGDLHTAMDNVHDLTGKRPNRLLFGLEAWRSARRSSSILNRIFGTNNGGGFPSTGQVADLLEVDSILVSQAFENTANEAQAESLSKVMADHVLAYYAPPTPSIEQPSFMYSFRWAAPGIPNMQVERHPYDTKRKSEEIEVGYYQDEKITGSDYGFLLLAVNSQQ